MITVTIPVIGIIGLALAIVCFAIISSYDNQIKQLTTELDLIKSHLGVRFTYVGSVPTLITRG
jgi:MFS-type transporter involved in bile tolerance (Atg22 family)